MKLKNKAQITEWLEQGDLDSVLSELKQQLKASKGGANLLKTATSLSAQLGKVKDDKTKGIISYEQETLATNKLLDKVQAFVERIENEDLSTKPDKPTTVAKPPVQPINPSPEKSTAWYWWAAVLAIIFGVWWVFFHDNSVKAEIRICTNQNLSDLNWCNNDMPRLTMEEARQQGVVVAASFIGQTEEDPYITATLENAGDHSVFPTERIQLSMKEGGLGYAGQVTPSYGANWYPGFYLLELSYNEKPVGEKIFEIIGNTIIDDSPLLPFDSIKVNQNN